MTSSTAAAAITTAPAAMPRLTTRCTCCCGLTSNRARIGTYGARWRLQPPRRRVKKESSVMKTGSLIGFGLAALMCLGAAPAQQIDAASQAAARRVAIGTCGICHGRQGRSISPKYPVLAGQHANYLVAQIQAFKAQTRGDPDALAYMWGMAAPLDETMTAALADYYSRQVPAAGEAGDAATIARGQQIYQQGL